MEFDSNWISGEDQLSWTFSNGLLPLIKLRIDEVDWELMFWDNLVNAVNKTQTKARIYSNPHLDH